MVKVLSQAGISLADTYDVEGSIAGIEQLLPNEVQVVHDMATTLQGERISTTLIRAASAATAQNLAFSILVPAAALPQNAFRILGAIMEVSVTSRLTHANVQLQGLAPTVVNAMPFVVWDGTNEDTIRFADAGTVADRIVLRPDPIYTQLPLFCCGIEQPEAVASVLMRGLTSGFGAGDVTVTLTLYVGLMAISGLSSYGLAPPSW